MVNRSFDHSPSAGHPFLDLEIWDCPFGGRVGPHCHAAMLEAHRAPKEGRKEKV